jgi:hypothetical protein
VSKLHRSYSCDIIKLHACSKLASESRPQLVLSAQHTETRFGPDRIGLSCADADAPAHDPSVHAVFQDFSGLTWEKTNPELGNNSPEVAILHVNPNTKATELLIRTPKDFHVP